MNHQQPFQAFSAFSAINLEQSKRDDIYKRPLSLLIYMLDGDMSNAMVDISPLL